MRVLCLLAGVLLFTLIAGQTDTSRCPTNLPKGTSVQAFNNKCYEFMIHRHMDWPHTNNDCVAKGGKLLTINDIREQEFIMSTLRQLSFQGLGVWIGLSDITTEGTFIWASDEPVTFTYWAPGQPGGPLHGTEDCVLMKFRDSGHWHDYPCSNVFIYPENYSWVCEFDMLVVPDTTAAPPRTTTAYPPTT